MAGAVYIETLRRNWRQLVYWGIGLAIYSMYGFLMMPPTSEDMQSYVDLVDGLDSGMMRAVGIEDAAIFGTPEGFIGYTFFGYLLIILAVYAIIAGLNITASEEDSGIMDMFMGLPVPRWRVVMEKMLAHTTVVIGMLSMSFIGLLVGDAIAPQEVDVSATRYLEGVINVVPGTLLILAFTAFVATVARRRSAATFIAGGFVVISYLVDAIGRAADSDVADVVRELSIFSHYNGTTVLAEGLAVASVVGMFGLAVLLAAGAVTFFQRRDLAV